MHDDVSFYNYLDEEYIFIFKIIYYNYLANIIQNSIEKLFISKIFLIYNIINV